MKATLLILAETCVFNHPKPSKEIFSFGPDERFKAIMFKSSLQRNLSTKVDMFRYRFE